MNRGDRREPIFCDETDRKRFLTTLGEACAKTDGQILFSSLTHFFLDGHARRSNLRPVRGVAPAVGNENKKCIVNCFLK